MKHLKRLNPLFWKYRWRLFLGIAFIILSNYFRILTPQITGYVIDNVQLQIVKDKQQSEAVLLEKDIARKQQRYDLLIRRVTAKISSWPQSLWTKVMWCGITLMLLALFSGLFMFLMRQTIIVMSRHMEYDQKNEIFRHYLKLDTLFYKSHSTGDLMNRIAEDVGRVRMYTGPALMYFINLAATIGFSVYFMMATQPLLTLYVLLPLPLLAIAIYVVNTIINHKSERIQSLLSDLTTNAQESYSGIRVIKSFVQEKAMQRFFNQNSEDYRKNSISLSKMEAVYFPSMGLLIGLSTLIAILIGGLYSIKGNHVVTVGTITEFVMYVNLLTFPVSAIGWTASMMQRAAASQKRINEFLETPPRIHDLPAPLHPQLEGHIRFDHVDFTYSNTGIQALKQFTLSIGKGEKVAIIGHTGSGKTTIAQLLIRMFDPTNGKITIDGIPIQELSLQALRTQVSYVPQDVFLFSDTVSENIAFGLEQYTEGQVVQAAQWASVDAEIGRFPQQYQTRIGERGVSLSGGQKQRLSIARALIKSPSIVVFDDCLSAVDSKTEKEILQHLNQFLQDKTALIITHRIFSLMQFDQIIVLEEGRIVESGRHDTLMAANGYYRFLYDQQRMDREGEMPVGV